MTILIVMVVVFIIYRATKTKKATRQHQTIPKTLTSENKIRNPRRHLKEIKDYLKANPSFIVEDKKRINTRTGYPLAKQSSIDRSKKQLRETISFKSDNYYKEAGYSHWMAIDDYLLGIELPYLHAGIVAYKQGDWDIAEKWWLSILDIRPTNVLHQLEIMYRKQQRYKDIVQLYKTAEPFVNKYDRWTNAHTYSTYESEAILKEETHKKKDCSIGIKTYPSKIDINYLHLLQSVPKQ